MNFLKFFKRKITNNSANIAKERLQIIILHKKKSLYNNNSQDLIKKIQDDILNVLKKYIEVNLKDININAQNNSGSSTLKININIDQLSQKKRII